MKQNQEKFILESLIDDIRLHNRSLVCHGTSGPEKAYFISQIYEKYNLPIVILMASQDLVDRFLEDLHFFSKQTIPVTHDFPAYHLLPFKLMPYQTETAANRIRALYSLLESPKPPILTVTVSAILQKLIPKNEIRDYAELVIEDEDIDSELLIKKLLAGGYTRTTIVEEPGDFCIRGGILDIFTPLYTDPLRIELFGDRVDSLRLFSTGSQRTLKRIPEAVILPAGEAIIKPTRLPGIIAGLRERATKQELPLTKIRSYVNRIKNETASSEMAGLTSLIYPEPGTLFDYIPAETLYVIDEPKALDKAAIDFKSRAVENHRSAKSESRFCLETKEVNLAWREIKDKLQPEKKITFEPLPIKSPDEDNRKTVSRLNFSIQKNDDLALEIKRRREKGNLLLPLARRVEELTHAGLTTLLVCRGNTQVERLLSLLKPYDIKAHVVDHIDSIRGDGRKVYICRGQVSAGFVWAAQSLAIITEDDIFGEKQRRHLEPKPRISARSISLGDLQQGNYVVHPDHGIGQYEGLVKLRLNGAENDFLMVSYCDGDKLYLPVERMGAIQKYMGVEGMVPKLDRLGGTSWERVKKKVKKSAEKIAGELLKIYAERKASKGHSFSGPGGYFRDFEAGFPFEETEDQHRAIQDVIGDMCQAVPMDRLICGDVGYGKTEVALRASFIAVNDGRQVAILVPTTILAEQHFATFLKRYENYPVNVACLSRFRTLKEQRTIVSDIRSGKVDIVVGTHRLLQKDIAFKELGLIVLDEEQRFGVKHKEKLKQMRRTVDVLALTATPIPRTLYLSLMGIRDISVISTPPEHRHPIITYLSEFDETVVRDAIKKELDRKGQLYFVHNNIANIRKTADFLQQLVPEVRLDVAHGRMDEDELEQVMLKFVRHDIDMLVCTTIVESGLDIPTANTILVNRADRFGLAQMYQLRGRVGRAGRQAYAFLFIPKESILGRDAQKRLKVLMEHSDLGSGFQIAMNDLRIRGGGTILGASQSGHIAAVGYEMFLKLMEESIAEFKGEDIAAPLEPEINLMISAFIPESYISDIDQRLSAYRRLARMTDVKEVADFKSELLDRYGRLPPEALNLLLKMLLKILSIKAGVKRLDLIERRLSLYFSEEHQKNPSNMVDLILKNPDHCRLTPEHVLQVQLNRKGSTGEMSEIKNILKEISQHVNG